MTTQRRGQQKMTRRSWLVLTASALSACGGGGSGGVASLPGTGGTGISMQGPISGFGSVIVGSTKFDDSTSLVTVDGIPSTSGSLRIGMVAMVDGERASGAVSGTAKTIEVWSIAQGPVTQTGVSSFELAGMAIQTDAATAFEGIRNAAALVAGDFVTVWGLQVSPDGHSWKATRVAMLNDPTAARVSTGLVEVDVHEVKLNDLVLSGPAVAGLSDKALYRMQGTPNAAGDSMIVSQATPLGLGVAHTLPGTVELEGMVSSAPSGGRFTLGATLVDAGGASISPSAANIALGSRVEVRGSWQAGVLMASRVEVKDAETLAAVDILGAIEAFNSASDFVIRGQQCDASGAQSVGGKLSDLRTGVKVRIQGINTGDETLLVMTLTFNP